MLNSGKLYKLGGQDDFASYEEARQYVFDQIQEKGFCWVTKACKFKPFQRKFFNVVRFVCPSLYEMGETNRFEYYHIAAKRSIKHSPQLRLEKGVVLNKCSEKQPFFVNVHTDFGVIRPSMKYAGWYLAPLLTISVYKQRIPSVPEKARKVVITQGDGKATGVGSVKTYTVHQPEGCLFYHRWCNTSRTHWEEGYLIVVPADMEIIGTATWCGKSGRCTQKDFVF